MDVQFNRLPSDKGDPNELLEYLVGTGSDLTLHGRRWIREGFDAGLVSSI